MRLDDDSTIGGYDATWTRLARDSSADYGIPPIISTGTWRNNNASRYIRRFQSRRSLLAWKVFGRRLEQFEKEAKAVEASGTKEEIVEEVPPTSDR